MTQLIGLYAFMLSPALVPFAVHVCGAISDAITAARRRTPARPAPQTASAGMRADRPRHRATPARSTAEPGPRPQYRRTAADPSAEPAA